MLVPLLPPVRLALTSVEAMFWTLKWNSSINPVEVGPAFVASMVSLTVPVLTSTKLTSMKPVKSAPPLNSVLGVIVNDRSAEARCGVKAATPRQRAAITRNRRGRTDRIFIERSPFSGASRRTRSEALRLGGWLARPLTSRRFATTRVKAHKEAHTWQEKAATIGRSVSSRRKEQRRQHCLPKTLRNPESRRHIQIPATFMRKPENSLTFR